MNALNVVAEGKILSAEATEDTQLRAVEDKKI